MRMHQHLDVDEKLSASPQLYQKGCLVMSCALSQVLDYYNSRLGGDQLSCVFVQATIGLRSAHCTKSQRRIALHTQSERRLGQLAPSDSIGTRRRDIQSSSGERPRQPPPRAHVVGSYGFISRNHPLFVYVM